MQLLRGLTFVIFQSKIYSNLKSGWSVRSVPITAWFFFLLYTRQETPKSSELEENVLWLWQMPWNCRGIANWRLSLVFCFLTEYTLHSKAVFIRNTGKWLPFWRMCHNFSFSIYRGWFYNVLDMIIFIPRKKSEDLVFFERSHIYTVMTVYTTVLFS